MATARVNGAVLYYEVHGDGSPVAVIPGLGGDTRLFAPIVAALAEQSRVVVFDPRGAGRSDKPDRPYSIELMADDAAGLLEVIGMSAATVVGHSMGGRIALSLALHHPERVGHLVLAATSARTPPIPPFGWRWFVIDVLGRIPLPRFIDPQPRYAHDRQLQASRAFDCAAELDQIKVPTVVVHGRRDHLVPYPLALELHAGIPGARMVTVRGGHFGPITSQRRRLIEATREMAG